MFFYQAQALGCSGRGWYFLSQQQQLPPELAHSYTKFHFELMNSSQLFFFFKKGSPKY